MSAFSSVFPAFRRSIVLLLLSVSTAVTTSGQSEGVLAYDEGRFGAAEELFEASYAAGEARGEAAAYLGRIHWERRDGKAAIKWLERAVAEAPNEAEYHYWLSNAYFNHIASVGLLKKGGLAKKGKSSAEDALSLDPSHAGARMSIIQYYAQAPRIAGGSMTKAREHAEILYTHHPRRGHEMMAMIHVRSEDFEAAAAEFERYVEAFPDDSDVLYKAGIYHQGRESYAQAFDYFERAVAANELALSAHYQLGRTAVLSNEQTQRGIAAYEFYLAQEVPDNLPSHASANWRLGMLFEQAGQLDAARAAYAAALQEEPEHEDARKALDLLDQK